jgi:hypothetical protein
VLRVVFRLVFPAEIYVCFTGLCCFGFGWVVLWSYSYGLNTIPESRRYAVEFEMFLLLLVIEYLRLVLRERRPVNLFCAVVPVLVLIPAGWPQVRKYLGQGFQGRRPFPTRESIEHKLAAKLWDLKPSGRVYASGGGLRFRLNSWFPLAQIGGGFESGLRNRMPLRLEYQIRTGMNSQPGGESDDAILGLKAMGVQYVVVHGPNSRQYDKGFRNPRKFEGLLEVVHREEDEVIYRVPFDSYAHLVASHELVEWPAWSKLPVIEPYVKAKEDPLRPKLKTTWRGPNELLIEGAVNAGTAVAVQVSHDPGWEARQDGLPIPVLRDRLGFLLLHANPARATRIELEYRGTREQKVMAGVSGVVWIAALGLLFRSRRGGDPGDVQQLERSLCEA